MVVGYPYFLETSICYVSCWLFSLFPRIGNPSFQTFRQIEGSNLGPMQPMQPAGAGQGGGKLVGKMPWMWKKKHDWRNKHVEMKLWNLFFESKPATWKKMWKNCIVCHVWPTRILDAYSHIYCEQNYVPFGVPSSRVGSSYSILTLYSFCRGHSYLGCIPAHDPNGLRYFFHAYQE